MTALSGFVVERLTKDSVLDTSTATTQSQLY